MKSAAEAALPGILRAELEAALGRSVSFGAVRIWPTGVWVDNLHVSRLPGESRDPLTVRRLQVRTDLWLLLTARKLSLTGITLDGARIDLAQVAPKAGAKPWTTQVLALSRLGVQRVALSDSSFRLTSSDNGETEAETVNATGVNGTLLVANDSFQYAARAASFTHPEGDLAGLHVAGVGDADGVRITRSGAVYRGGKLSATGTVRSKDNAALVSVKVQRLPLKELAPRLRIPAQWATNGNIHGEVTVDARDGALRQVKGLLTLDRGPLKNAEGEFPWTRASANVDWTPQRATLKGIRVEGGGLELLADGEVQIPAGRPFTESPFSLDGELKASGTRAVAQVADLLASRKLLDGRWEAGNAGVRFHAEGKAGDLENATASGHLRVDDLRFRPTQKSGPILVSRLEGDLRRSAGVLALTGIEGRTGTLSILGSANVTDDQPGKPGRVEASATLEVRDLKSFRRAVPDSLLWKWIPVASPNASATVLVKASGPTATPSAITTQGSFEVRDFRLSARSPLPNGAVFFIPVRTLRGDFEQNGPTFLARNVDLQAVTFQGDGEVKVNLAQVEPTYSADFRIRTDDWRSLPAMPPTVIPELTGGSFEGRVQVADGYSGNSDAPVSGSFELRDAVYTPGREGATPVPVQRFAADFKWVKRVLELPSVVVETPIISGEALGTIRPDLKDYRLALDVTARTSNVGALAGRFSSEIGLSGGEALARFHVESPIERLAEASLLGTIHAVDLSTTEAVAYFGPDKLAARTVDIDFARLDEKWRLSRMEWKGNGLTATVRGDLSEQLVSADVSIETDRWVGPKSLPLSGGTLAIDGRLVGEWSKPDALQFSGEAEVEGATLKYQSERLALTGQRLSALAVGTGTLANPREWLQRAEVTVHDGSAVIGDQPRQAVTLASGSLQRHGDGFLIQDLRLQTLAFSGKARGRWSETAHSLALSADVTDPAQLGFALPKGVSIRTAHFDGELQGTAREPLAKLSGAVRGIGLKLPAHLAGGLEVESLTANLTRAGEEYRLRDVKVNSPALTLSGEGEWSADAHHLRFTASGRDATRLGITLPEGFTVAAFDLKADLRGTGKAPFSRGAGRLTLANGRVPFEPAHPIQVTTASTRWVLADKQVAFSQIEATGPIGHVTGTGNFGPDGFRLALAGTDLEPRLASWLVPGTFRGGKLAGTMELRGAENGTISSVDGKFALANAAYALPEKLELSPQAVQVAALSGNYRWSDGTTRVDDLILDGDLIDAMGSYSSSRGTGQLQAKLSTGDSGRAAAFWPQLAELLRGGKATGELNATFADAGVQGTLQVKSSGGTLVVPSAPAEYAQQPIDEASMLIGFAPGQLKLESIRVRGPKANADGEFTWTENGPVFGKGKAWFAKDYTSKMLKPSGFGWLAKLFGVREIKTDWELSGSSDKVTLNAAITRSFMWKFAKGKVPKEFQEIAAGKSPLWVKPLEVVATHPRPAASSVPGEVAPAPSPAVLPRAESTPVAPDPSSPGNP